MKILILTFYFRPDLCAGSFRVTPLVDVLRELVSNDSKIDVVTTLPNRYHSFTTDAAPTEQLTGLSIYRIAVPNHQSGMIDQSKIFLAFLREALRKVEGQDYDLVFATSSRLMTAVLGAWIAQKKKARLYLDIRDIFVDTIKDVLPRKFALAARPLFSILEKWTVKRADKVNLVSGGFEEYFRSRYPHQHFSFFTNGIDDDFLPGAKDHISVPHVLTGKKQVTVLYAGNLGEGQGLHRIVPLLAEMLGDRVCFRIIGDGGRKEVLESEISRKRITNVELLPPVSREELLNAYSDADVLFLHLNDYDAFKKVLPSKIFEYAALGKPIWAGVSGYSAEFIKSEISNSAVFHPCDAQGAVTAFGNLIFRDSPRPEFIKKYARRNISRMLAEDILAIAREER